MSVIDTKKAGVSVGSRFVRGFAGSKIAAGTDAAPPTRVGGGRRRPTGLRSVVQETTPEVAMEKLNDCPTFELPPTPAGERRWLALLLEVSQIGGLSDKDKRDVDKGEIVQQMGGGSLDVVITEQMLEHGFLAFILTQRSLATMSEYRMLTSAPYQWIVFKAGIGADTGVLFDDAEIGPATFDQALVVSEGRALAEIVGTADADAWQRALSSLGGDPAVTTVRGDLSSPLATDNVDSLDSEDSAGQAEEEESDDDEGSVAATALPPAFDDIIDDSAQDDTGFDYAAAEAEGALDDDEFELGDLDDAPSDFGVPDEVGDTEGAANVVIDDVTVEVDPQVLVEALGDEALPLPVAADSLEALLPADEPPSITYSLPAFAGAEVSPWLREQVRLLAEASDLELKALHLRQRNALRAAYLEQMHGYAHRIDGVLAVHGEGLFGKQLALLTEERNGLLAVAEVTARGMTEQNRARYEQEAQLHAERVAAQARASWMANVEPKLRLEFQDAVRELSEKAEAGFALAKITLMDSRREKAVQLMAKAELDALNAAKALAAEQAETLAGAVNAHTEAIRAAVRTAYSADVERVDVLAKQQAIGEEVALVNARADQRVADLKADYENRLEASRQSIEDAEATIVKTRTEAVDAVANLRSGLEEHLDARAAVVADLREQLGFVLANSRENEERLRKTFEVDLAAARQDAETWRKQNPVVINDERERALRDEGAAKLQSVHDELDALRQRNSTQRIISWAASAAAAMLLLAVIVIMILTRG